MRPYAPIESDTANRVPYRFRHRRRCFSADVRCPCSSSRVAGLPPPLPPPPRQRDCAPPCAQTRTKRCGLFGTLIFLGGRGGQNTSEYLETHAKKRVPNRTRGGRCGCQSGGALPAFRPLSRPFNVGQMGKPCGAARSWVGAHSIKKGWFWFGTRLAGSHSTFAVAGAVARALDGSRFPCPVPFAFAFAAAFSGPPFPFPFALPRTASVGPVSLCLVCVEPPLVRRKGRRAAQPTRWD